MNRILGLLSIISLMFALAEIAQAKEWRGIVPLKSTRADVVRLLGVSPDKSDSRYDFPDERVFIDYSYPCSTTGLAGWPAPPPGYDVPPDTVVAISVYLKKPVPLASLTFDLSKFERGRGDYDLPQHFYYVNKAEGLAIGFFDFGAERGEIVQKYIYAPTAKEEEIFRCKGKK